MEVHFDEVNSQWCTPSFLFFSSRAVTIPGSLSVFVLVLSTRTVLTVFTLLYSRTAETSSAKRILVAPMLGMTQWVRDLLEMLISLVNVKW